MFTGSDQTLLDAQGHEFEADSGTALMNVPDSESSLTDINPGNSVDSVVVFDVPEGLTPAAIERHESMFLQRSARLTRGLNPEPAPVRLRPPPRRATDTASADDRALRRASTGHTARRRVARARATVVARRADLPLRGRG
jgi:hypothetical protein